MDSEMLKTQDWKATQINQMPIQNMSKTNVGSPKIDIGGSLC